MRKQMKMYNLFAKYGYAKEALSLLTLQTTCPQAKRAVSLGTVMLGLEAVIQTETHHSRQTELEICHCHSYNVAASDFVGLLPRCHAMRPRQRCVKAKKSCTHSMTVCSKNTNKSFACLPTSLNPKNSTPKIVVPLIAERSKLETHSPYCLSLNQHAPWAAKGDFWFQIAGTANLLSTCVSRALQTQSSCW